MALRRHPGRAPLVVVAAGGIVACAALVALVAAVADETAEPRAVAERRPAPAGAPSSSAPASPELPSSAGRSARSPGVPLRPARDARTMGARSLHAHAGGAAAATTPGDSAPTAAPPAARADGGVTPPAAAVAAPAAAPPAPPHAAPDGGASRPEQKLAGVELGRRAQIVERDSSSGADGYLVRVARFAPAGGASLEGRVSDAESGRPLVGVVVEARLAARFVETTTEASGAFRMPGMLPGTRVALWVGGKTDHFVSERIDVAIPGEGQTAEVGVVGLLPGDELASRLDGWAGLFVARRAGRIVVSAVSAWLPADLAGIEVGDLLVAVNGRDVTALGPRAVTFLLRGPTGSTLSVVVQGRDGTRRTLSLPRVRR